MVALLYKWVLILGASGLFILCDGLSAKWAETTNKWFLLVLIPIAPTAYFLFALLNKKMTLGASGALVNTAIVLGAVLLGKIYFGEILTNVQYIGLILALGAIVLLSS